MVGIKNTSESSVLHFSNVCVTRPTDRPTNQPTDMTSYRSAMTHLKTDIFSKFLIHVLNSSSGKRIRQEMENRGLEIRRRGNRKFFVIVPPVPPPPPPDFVLTLLNDLTVWVQNRRTWRTSFRPKRLSWRRRMILMMVEATKS